MVDLTSEERHSRRLAVERHRRQQEEAEKAAFGKESEDMLWNAIHERGAQTPAWFLGMRRANHVQDMNGTDFIAVVDAVGDVNIQVKSSRNWIDKFRSNHPDFKGLIFVVHRGKTNKDLRGLFFHQLGVYREREKKRRSSP
ncbi:MAG: hypothetical protein ABA06_01535 [Parcubacteria bacterium C7867-001]|nr:MAG: hypothetical protein ABA06_01535 [Parcubacteria bacterium C7867-001]